MPMWLSWGVVWTWTLCLTAGWAGSTVIFPSTMWWDWHILTVWLFVILIIILKEICEVPTLWFKALNKHNTHNVPRDGECYPQFNQSWHMIKCTHQEGFRHYYVPADACLHAHAHTHTHTHTRRCTHTHTLSLSHTHTLSLSYTHTHTHTPTHAHTHARTHTHTHVHMRTYTHRAMQCLNWCECSIATFITVTTMLLSSGQPVLASCAS